MARTPSTRAILREIKSIELHLNELQMIPATALYRNVVLLGLLSKALTLSRAICALIDRGFQAEAFGLSRTLIEIYFSIRYISNKDTEMRAETFVKYAARVRVEWQRIIKEHYPNTPAHLLHLDDDVIETAKGFQSRGFWTGLRGQTKEMAFEEDTVELNQDGQPLTSEFDYELYFWASQFVHATVEGIAEHAGERGKIFKIHARKSLEDRYGRNAQYNVLVFVLKSFIHACRVMNEDQPPALQRLFKMISQLPGPETGPATKNLEDSVPLGV